MPADPEPKDARTAGAQARSRLVPNSARTAAVSTTTPELAGIGRERPEHEQVACWEPARLERRAHHLIAGHRHARAYLLGDPGGRLPADRRLLAGRGGLDGLPARVPVKCLTATTASDPMTRAGITIRAASPAPSQLADSGSASGVASDAAPGAGAGAGPGPAAPGGGAASGDLPAIPSHSVTSSSVTGPALATRGGCCFAATPGPGALVPAGLFPLRTEGRRLPHRRWAGPCRAPSSAMPVNPPAGRMPDDANRTV